MPPSTSSFVALRSIRTSRPVKIYTPLSNRLPQQIPRIQPLHLRCSSSQIPSTTPASITKPRPAHAPKQAINPNTLPQNQNHSFPSKPEYEMTFTCKPCSTRSTHRVSKQGYHYGSVLITCPECRNRHVISDHLSIFGDKHMTIEDLMREQGQLVKRGTLSEDGDLEFWVDGSVTERGKGAGDSVKVERDGEGAEDTIEPTR